MSYNGWTNYETWLVKLWLDNDEGTQSMCFEIARDAVESAVIEYTWQSREDTERRAIEEAIKEFVTEQVLPDLGCTLAADLLGAAVSKVDWYAIAEAYQEEIKEQIDA